MDSRLLRWAATAAWSAVGGASLPRGALSWRRPGGLRFLVDTSLSVEELEQLVDDAGGGAPDAVRLPVVLVQVVVYPEELARPTVAVAAGGAQVGEGRDDDGVDLGGGGDERDRAGEPAHHRGDDVAGA